MCKKILVVSASLMLNVVLFAQTDSTKKAKEISSLKEIINGSTDVAEISKAKRLLQELEGGTSATVAAPAKTQQQLDFEEQQHASETLSPAEYDAWKAAKVRATSNQQNNK